MVGWNRGNTGRKGWGYKRGRPVERRDDVSTAENDVTEKRSESGRSSGRAFVHLIIVGILSTFISNPRPCIVTGRHIESTGRTMDLATLQSFVAAENERLYEYYDLGPDEAPLAQTVKLNEEVGELCDSVLGYRSLQRAEKLAGFDERDMDEEFADVIITAFLLADSVGVDVESALEAKIAAVEDRYE